MRTTIAMMMVMMMTVVMKEGRREIRKGANV
jgi:hypothetical protein